MKALLIPVLLAAMAVGCMGRKTDDHKTAMDLSTMNVERDGKPVLLVFGAVWCVPCRSEIDVLNQAQSEFGDDIHIIGAMVEGKEHGQVFRTSSLDGFTTQSGEGPQYRLQADDDWQTFKTAQFTDNALPAIAVLNGEHRIEYRFQRTLEYESELRPLIQSLISGSPVTLGDDEDFDDDLVDDTVEGDTGDSGLPKKMTVSEWQESLPDTEKSERIYLELKQGWRDGVKKIGFKASDVPLDKGKMTLTYDDELFPLPLSVRWSYQSENGSCFLMLRRKSSGEYTATGRCQ